MSNDLRVHHYESAQFPDKVPTFPEYQMPQEGDHPIECYMAVRGLNRNQFLAWARKVDLLVWDMGSGLMADAAEVRAKGRAYAQAKKAKKKSG